MPTLSFVHPPGPSPATSSEKEESDFEGTSRFPADVTLMALVASGNADARRSLAMRLMPRVRRTVGSFVRHQADAQDVAQQSLIAILTAAHGYRGDAPVEGWADRIVVRTALRAVRKRGEQSSQIDAHADPDEVPVEDQGAGDSLMAPQVVESFLSRLSPVQRQTLLLRHSFGHSIDEIASLMGVSTNTVKDRLRTALEQVRRVARRRSAADERAGSG